MNTASSVIEGAYIRDILEQPDAIARTLALPLPANLAEFRSKLCSANPPSVILTGMGSSYYALQPLAIRLAQSGIRALLLETSELVHYWEDLLDPRTIVIAVSQSGRTAEITHFLELNRGKAGLISITNDPSSPLACGSDSLVLLDAGTESNVSCKTYTCSLLALSQVGEVLCGGDLDQWKSAASSVPNAARIYLSNWREHVEDLMDRLDGIHHMVLAGRGHSLATTGTGALIIKEATRFPAEGMSAAAFRHGPLEMVSGKLFVLVFLGDERTSALNARLAEDIASIGGNATLVSDESEFPVFRTQSTIDTLRPVLEILPVQMITLALAATSGHEAGSFAHGSKVTLVE